MSRADHSFISQIESRSRQGTPSQPPNSLPTLAPQHYTVDQPRQPHTTIRDGALSFQHQHGDTLTHNMLQQKLVTGYSSYAPIFEEQRLPQHSSSSVSLGQSGRQMLPSNDPHSQSYTNLHSNYSSSNGVMMRGAETSTVIDPLNGQSQPQQWAAGEVNQAVSSTSSRGYNGMSAISQGSIPMYNGDPRVATTSDVNGIYTSNYAIPMNNTHLATPTSTGDLKYSRQISSASSGYYTASSTERHSVVSMLSRDQSLGEIHVENSLQVISTPHRKVSAPPNCSPKTKKMLNQQSQSLTNLTQDIPEYPYDNEENEHREGDECREHPSLQRQDTGHSTKVVFAGLGDSVSGEQYQSVMGTKRKMPKQNAVEEGMLILFIANSFKRIISLIPHEPNIYPARMCKL